MLNSYALSFWLIAGKMSAVTVFEVFARVAEISQGCEMKRVWGGVKFVVSV